ncbi:ankyrin repeat protein, putative [Trichomonas vaginalis G3]|uniref:Ankyrin repeat protein, putative n=1 Tax=Trichomonas vaginalis (strain ATCC PRA-98 / G3) TaxID=412133 RepID=A2DQ74_TRIV3|nr:proteasome regulatory particle assembly [Trichomonas vaginalis G3]EAY17501.1 ankyrin repeat protein, putative [Trichomonas vaginalis G3]KAI5533606.1 proteasome regulatory particle assembly [Trichomonas vaginalis G3]|eukprot:XP_001329636.1 ankyrin repeat protein [Trichomonas vaginalis G3]
MFETKHASPNQILTIISTAMAFNIKYIKSYKEIFKMIYQEYHLIFTRKEVQRIPYILWGDLQDENNILLSTRYSSGIEANETKDYSLNFIEDNTIYRTIIYDDKFSFIIFTESNNFDKNQMLHSDLYPSSPNSLLELCCYHGAVNCFKLLISKFNSIITPKCLYYSFLGGNPDIIDKCLQVNIPDEECMKYAIISHNIDFVTFLMNEFELDIDLKYCIIFHNIQAFLVYLDQSKYINKFFIYSTCFCIPSLCEYFISHGAFIDAKNQSGETALHFAAKLNCIEIEEVLISHDADVNAKDNDGWSVLHSAAESNSKETAEFLISHGADVNAKDNDGWSVLHSAAESNSKETAEFLISHGADVNAKDNDGWSVLHSAAESNSKETAEFLISHGADVNAKDKN